MIGAPGVVAGIVECMCSKNKNIMFTITKQIKKPLITLLYLSQSLSIFLSLTLVLPEVIYTPPYKLRLGRPKKFHADQIDINWVMLI